MPFLELSLSAALLAIAVGAPEPTSPHANGASGWVRGRDGGPIVGARVRWRLPDAALVAGTVTARDGSWSLAPPPAGTSPALEASATGYHTDRATWAGAAMPIVLLRASAIRGRIASLDPGLVAARPTLRLDRHGGPDIDLACDEGGSFVAEGLEAGDYRLTATAVDFEPKSLAFALGAELVDAGLIELDPGPRVRGRLVRAEDGAALAGAKLRLVRAEKHRPWSPKTRAEMEGASDAEGRFSLARVPPGPLLLLVDSPGRPPGWSQRIEVGTGGAELGEIAVPPAAALVGRVEGRDGKPRAGLVIALVERPEPGRRAQYTARDVAPEAEVPEAHATRSDDDGAFRLARLPAGDWDLVAVSGGVLARREVRLVAGKESREQLTIDGVTLSGRVHDAGAPQAGARLNLQERLAGSPIVEHQVDAGGTVTGTSVYGRLSQSRARTFHARTEADGSYVFPAVPTGVDLELSVRGEGVFALRRLRADDGATADLDIDLSWLGVTGQVVRGPAAGGDAGGAAAADTNIGFAEADGLCCYWFPAAGDGRFRLSPAVPGAFSLRVLLGTEVELDTAEPGYGLVPVVLQIGAGVGSEHDQPELRVRATATDGRPLDALTVAYWNLERGGTATASQGAELRIRLQPGRYQLLVSGREGIVPLQTIDIDAAGRDIAVALQPSGEIDALVPGGSSPEALEIFDEAGNALTSALRNSQLLQEREDGVLLRVWPGSYRLVLRDGERLASSVVAVAAGSRVRVTLGFD